MSRRVYRHPTRLREWIDARTRKLEKAVCRMYHVTLSRHSEYLLYERLHRTNANARLVIRPRGCVGCTKKVSRASEADKRSTPPKRRHPSGEDSVCALYSFEVFPQHPVTGSIGISKPRTLIDKARQDTKKIQHVWTGPSGSSGSIARRKTVPLGHSALFMPRPTQSTQLHPNSVNLAKKSSSGPNAAQPSPATETSAASVRLHQKSRQFEGSFVD